METSTLFSPSSTTIVSSPYRKILVPHDGSEMSDRALNHALYIAKMASAEIVIFHVIEADRIPPSTLLAFIKPDAGLDNAREEVRNIFEEAVGRMLEDRVQEAKALGINAISYKISSGSPADAIIIESEANQYDLIVMSSSRIVSTIRTLGSTARRVLDSTRTPVLLIHE
jgi:nucleotide-binding universal stress UspA family protein